MIIYVMMLISHLSPHTSHDNVVYESQEKCHAMTVARNVNIAPGLEWICKAFTETPTTPPKKEQAEEVKND